jgi:hypothetical protein
VKPDGVTEEKARPLGAAGSVDAFVHAYVVELPPADHASTAMQYAVFALNPVIEWLVTGPAETPVMVAQLVP